MWTPFSAPKKNCILNYPLVVPLIAGVLVITKKKFWSRTPVLWIEPSKRHIFALKKLYSGTFLASYYKEWLFHQQGHSKKAEILRNMKYRCLWSRLFSHKWENLAASLLFDDPQKFTNRFNAEVHDTIKRFLVPIRISFPITSYLHERFTPAVGYFTVYFLELNLPPPPLFSKLYESRWWFVN